MTQKRPHSATFPMARDVAPGSQIAPVDSTTPANGIRQAQMRSWEIRTVRAFLVALALLGATSSAMADATSSPASGAAAIEGCRAADTGRTTTVDRVLFDAGFCMGIVAGTMWGLQLTDLVCLPKGVTIGQGLKVLIRYMDDHPEELDKETAELVARASVKAWPCSR
jgi:hypothetical protein